MKLGIGLIVLTLGAASPLFGASSASKEAEEIRNSLRAGRELVQKGKPEEAIAKHFNPVIEHYEQSRKKGTRYFSASDPGQALIYLALPAAAGESVDAIVTDDSWADAHLMKGYALIEMHRLDDGQAEIAKAVELSPFNSQYKAELAYTYQQQGKCERSIELYSEAADNAEMASAESTKTADLTRAWRGQGYCLVELKKWDEAAAMYRKCLVLDPKDDKATGELRYVDEHRPN